MMMRTCARRLLLRPVASRRTLCAAADGPVLSAINEATAVATVTINRPKALNALNTAVILGLRDTYKALEKDDRVRAIVLTGSERAFAAGADIKEMLASVDVRAPLLATCSSGRLDSCRTTLNNSIRSVALDVASGPALHAARGPETAATDQPPTHFTIRLPFQSCRRLTNSA